MLDLAKETSMTLMEETFKFHPGINEDKSLFALPTIFPSSFPLSSIYSSDIRPSNSKRSVKRDFGSH